MGCFGLQGPAGTAEETGINAGVYSTLNIRGYAVSNHNGLVFLQLWDILKTIFEKMKGWLFIPRFFRYEHSVEKMEKACLLKPLYLSGVNSV